MKRLALLGLLLILLAGCVDYNEELWLNKDRSGRVKMVIGVLTTYLNQQELNRYTSQPGITLISKSVYRKQDYTYYYLDFRFASLEAFNNVNDQINNADFLGKITLTKEKDGSVTLTRRIALGSTPGEEDEIEQLIMTHPQDNLKWRYKLHLPWKIVKTNAAATNTDMTTNTVSWIYQTSYLWNKSQTMTVNMKQPFPLLYMGLIALAVVLIVLCVILISRRRSKSKRRPVSIIPPATAKE
jgi:hypothetical protein